MLGTVHVGVVVADLERSIAFYGDLLGLELLGSMERSGADISTMVGLPNAVLKIARLKLPNTSITLELIQYLSPKGQPVDTLRCNPGNAHICFRTENIRSDYERLSAEGVEFISEPVEVTAGMNRGALVAYFRDPDGITMELQQPAASFPISL